MNPEDIKRAIWWRAERAAAQLYGGDTWAMFSSSEKSKRRDALIAIAEAG